MGAPVIKLQLPRIFKRAPVTSNDVRSMRRDLQNQGMVVTRRSALASYDSAETSPLNEEHWARASSQSANAVASASVRRVIRNRARYECRNNAYCIGMLTTYTNDIIGNGPTMLLRSSSIPRDDLRFIEREWANWCAETEVASKMRTSRGAQVRDGDGFMMKSTSARLEHPVKLYPRLFEAEMVEDESGLQANANEVDGVRIDKNGDPVAYRILKQHPGDTFAMRRSNDASWHSWRDVIHTYRCDRPHQVRGVSEIQPALALFAVMRRWTLASLHSAEKAARVSMVMHTNHPPLSDCTDYTMEEFDIPIDSILGLPQGYSVDQIKSEHPTATYDAVKKTIVAEIGRVLNMPYNVVAADSSGYNYSSGRLDHQIYDRQLEIERRTLEDRVLRRLFFEWFAEASVVDGYMPPSIHRVGVDMAVQWLWPQRATLDPVKQAQANKIMRESGQITDQRILAPHGITPEEHYDQLQIEQAAREDRGIAPTDVADASAKAAERLIRIAKGEA